MADTGKGPQDSAKAKAELGYQARAYCAGLKDALTWFSANGYLT